MVLEKNREDTIGSAVQIMKFLIVEPFDSPFSTLLTEIYASGSCFQKPLAFMTYNIVGKSYLEKYKDINYL